MYTKLTDENNRTRNGMQWGDGVSHGAPGDGELCTDSWIHAYSDLDEFPGAVALFWNPIHAGIKSPHLWRVAIDGESKSGLDKLGARMVTTVAQLPLPCITIRQRVEIAIRCAMCVCQDEIWRAWAIKWLSGEYRSNDATRAVLPSGSEKSCLAARAASLAAMEMEDFQESAAVNAAIAAAWAVDAAVNLDISREIIRLVMLGESA